MSVPDLSVVFPVYNEEANLPILLSEIADALREGLLTYEIVAVNDGSRDRSLETLRQCRSAHPTLRILSLDRNSGQTAALDAAWRAALGNLVISLDADLQNDPADIPRMLGVMRDMKADMVIGVRVNRMDSAWKKIQSRIGNGVRNWITGDQITDTGCSLKLVRRECIQRLKLFHGMHRFLPSLVRIEGFSVVETPVNHRPRRFGTSNYGAWSRAVGGLADCFAVRWMAKRTLRYEVTEENPLVAS